MILFNSLDLYREALHDPINSAFWFIRALSTIGNELKRIKENLEKDFNNIRQKFSQNDYAIDNNVGLIKYDAEFLPILFYRIQGILYMNIDIDKVEELSMNFETIFNKILKNFSLISDKTRIMFEREGFFEQMSLLSIFGFHFNINGLKDYEENSEKINLETSDKVFLNYSVYNHNLLKSNLTNSKISFKLASDFLKKFVETVFSNFFYDNCFSIEKVVLILFYWFSLNFDLFNVLIDDDLRKNLKFLNFILQNDPEIKLILNNENMLKQKIETMNNFITPLESIFYCFVPLHRFFILNKKSEILKIDDIKETTILNRISLINFLNLFGLKAENDEILNGRYFKKDLIKIKEKTIENKDIKEFEEMKNQMFGNITKAPLILNVKKSKPLILLDASNIAMRHGDGSFSTKGIDIVMNFFRANGHQVMSFLPEYLFKSSDSVSSKDKKRTQPDDINYLKQLYEKTPPQDYDDSYIINYCKQKDAYIVTNDLYRDYIEKSKDYRTKEKEKLWVKEKCISFTFNQDEFLPNPDSAFFQFFNLQEYHKNAENLIGNKEGK